MIYSLLPSSTTRNHSLYSQTRVVLYYIFCICLEFLYQVGASSANSYPGADEYKGHFLEIKTRKTGRHNPLVSTRTPLPWEGRTKDVMQVLFHKHVWLFTEYMPTLHWWTGASSVSPYVIAITWGIASGIIIHHWSIAYKLFTYCSSLIYFSIATVQSLQNPKTLLLLPLPLLSYYFATKYLAADTKLSRCGWIDNSTANTQEYSLAPLVSNQ